VQPVAPGTYVQQGIASWYGPPFHGRQAADGEIFDMNRMVAAHRTLPFGSIVRVTNLDNGMQAEVRIIDRGPFVAGRIIDLSLAAARAIDMVRSGIAPVRIELVASPAPLNGVFAVQVGAFHNQDNALRLRTRLAARYPVTLEEFDAPAGHFYRVRVGREATEAAADRLADQLAHEDGFQTFVVRLDGIP
jgi:peptidoglycan lytic transglycosylase